jgi:hypothetical protein
MIVNVFPFKVDFILPFRYKNRKSKSSRYSKKTNNKNVWPLNEKLSIKFGSLN